MKLGQLTPQLYCAPQLTPEWLAAIQAAGIQTVLCNRPDGEEPGQPSFAEVTEWLQKAGIQTVYLPTVMSQITPQLVAQFQAACTDAQQPVLAYCRTGTRSTVLWALGQVQQGRSVADLTTVAVQAGIDLTPAAPLLQAYAAG